MQFLCGYGKHDTTLSASILPEPSGKPDWYKMTNLDALF